MNKTILITKNSNTPNLDRMDDKLLIINNKIHYKNLEEFNIKKFNQAHFVEWEQVNYFFLSLLSNYTHS